MDVRNYFDFIPEDYPPVLNRLSPTVDIVRDPTFEHATAKIKSGTGSQNSCEEKRPVFCLKNCTVNASNKTKEPCLADLAELSCKIFRVELSATDMGYLNTSFLLPTSYIVERLFYKAEFGLYDSQKVLLPPKFAS